MLDPSGVKDKADNKIEDASSTHRTIMKILRDNNVEKWEPNVVPLLNDLIIREAKRVFTLSYEMSKIAGKTDIDRDDIMSASNSIRDQLRITNNLNTTLEDELIESVNRLDIPPFPEGNGIMLPSNNEGTLLTPNWQVQMNHLV